MVSIRFVWLMISISLFIRGNPMDNCKICKKPRFMHRRMRLCQENCSYFVRYQQRGVRNMFVVELCVFAKRSLVFLLTNVFNEKSYRVRWIVNLSTDEPRPAFAFDSRPIGSLPQRFKDTLSPHYDHLNNLSAGVVRAQRLTHNRGKE